MRKFVLLTLAALAISSAALVQPAEARCWWNGYTSICSHPHGPWWHHHGPHEYHGW